MREYLSIVLRTSQQEEAEREVREMEWSSINLCGERKGLMRISIDWRGGHRDKWKSDQISLCELEWEKLCNLGVEEGKGRGI